MQSSILHLPHFDPIPLGRLSLPSNILFRRFLYSGIIPPSKQHFEALKEVEKQLIPIIG